VLALMIDNKTWHVAEIYAAREAKYYNEELNESSEE